MHNYCFFGNKIMLSDDAKVSVYDIGLLRGYGIYEGITTFNKRPFRLDDHLDRFERSARALRLKIPCSRKKIAEILDELISRHDYKRMNFRMILTGGPAEGGLYYDEATPTFYILAEEWKPFDRKLYEEGASLMTYEHERLLPEMKTINYITAVSLQSERKRRGAVEILFTSKGNVLEASTSNFFLFKGDILVTPGDGILSGITRKVVLELARGHFAIEERPVAVMELKEADEAFISASYKDIMPIVEIDGRKIGAGSVGVNTKKIMDLFADYTKKYS